MKPNFNLLLVISIGLLSACDQYKGISYTDEQYHSGAQVIPGIVQLEYYDLGGEGIAYHDADSINSGSGHLNPADSTYFNEFRMKESADISYTKPKGIDDNPYNVVMPSMKQLYVGWTEPGEWIKYTVDVKTTGLYQVGLMYTSYGFGQIALSIDDVDSIKPLDVYTTYNAADSIGWRQWHHWNLNRELTQMQLTEGKHVLTLHTVSFGQMNYDYLSFDLIQE